MRSLLGLAAAAVVSVAFGSGCGGKEYVRGSQEPGIDNAAMSTGIDKEDIQRMLSENLNNLRTAPVMNEWRTTKPAPVVAVFPFQNSTSEHIDSQLDAILSEAEQWLVDSQTVSVVARDRQNQMVAEIEGQAHPAFNPANAARYGRQLGAKYFITGKVQAADERTDSARRVQYFFFMQVIEVETGIIKWQHKAYQTKMAR